MKFSIDQQRHLEENARALKEAREEQARLRARRQKMPSGEDFMSKTREIT